jgi:hypothetical protein
MVKVLLKDIVKSLYCLNFERNVDHFETTSVIVGTDIYHWNRYWLQQQGM